MSTGEDISELIEQIRNSKKYQGLNLPEETLRDLLVQETARYKKPAEALKSTRAKLHNIVAPYLGDLDYATATAELQGAFASHDSQSVKNTCTAFLSQHDSTRERLPYLKNFYQGIFSFAANPKLCWTWPVD